MHPISVVCTSSQRKPPLFKFLRRLLAGAVSKLSHDGWRWKWQYLKRELMDDNNVLFLFNNSLWSWGVCLSHWQNLDATPSSPPSVLQAGIAAPTSHRWPRTNTHTHTHTTRNYQNSPKIYLILYVYGSRLYLLVDFPCRINEGCVNVLCCFGRGFHK